MFNNIFNLLRAISIFISMLSIKVKYFSKLKFFNCKFFNEEKNFNTPLQGITVYVDKNNKKGS